MIWIPPGTFVMGSDQHYPEEAPAHTVELAGFWIDRGPVTNAQFLKFVKASGYRTVAERPAEHAALPADDASHAAGPRVARSRSE